MAFDGGRGEQRESGQDRLAPGAGLERVLCLHSMENLLDDLPKTPALVRATLMGMGMGVGMGMGMGVGEARAEPPLPETEAPSPASFELNGDYGHVVGEGKGRRWEVAERRARTAAIARLLAELRTALSETEVGPWLPPPPEDPLEEASRALDLVDPLVRLLDVQWVKQGRLARARFDIDSWARLVAHYQRKPEAFGLVLVQPLPSSPVHIVEVRPRWQCSAGTAKAPLPGDALYAIGEVEIRELSQLWGPFPYGGRVTLSRDGRPFEPCKKEKHKEPDEKAPTCGPCCHSPKGRDCQEW